MALNVAAMLGEDRDTVLAWPAEKLAEWAVFLGSEHDLAWRHQDLLAAKVCYAIGRALGANWSIADFMPRERIRDREQAKLLLIAWAAGTKRRRR